MQPVQSQIQNPSDAVDTAAQRPVTRRTTLLGLAAAMATPLLAGSFARAQMMGGSDSYAADTLKVGGLALATSKVAAGKASAAGVKEFATLEIAEQETIAGILAAHGFNPPEMLPAYKEMVEKLSGMSGKEFDTAYLSAQIAGHNELLAIQLKKADGDAKDPQVIVAKLASGEIKSHLAMLKMIQTMV